MEPNYYETPLTDPERIKNRISSLRGHVPDIAHLNDEDFAKVYSERFPTDKTLSGLSAGGFSRSGSAPTPAAEEPSTIQKFFRSVDAGGDVLRDDVYKGLGGSGDFSQPASTDSDWYKRVIARTAGGLFANSPEMAPQIALGGAGKIGAAVAPLLSGASAYLHDKARGGDTTSASAQGLGQVIAPVAADYISSKLGVPKSFLRNAAAGFAGRMIADVPATLLMHNGEEGLARLEKNFDENYNPANPAARENFGVRALTDAAFGATHHLRELGKTREEKRLATVDAAAEAGALHDPIDKGFFKSLGIDPTSEQPEHIAVKSAYNDFVRDFNKAASDFANAPKDDKGAPSTEAYKKLNSDRTAAREKLSAVVASQMGVPLTSEQAANFVKNAAARYTEDATAQSGVRNTTDSLNANTDGVSGANGATQGSEPEASGGARSARSPATSSGIDASFFQKAYAESLTPDGYLPSSEVKSIPIEHLPNYSTSDSASKVAGLLLKRLVHLPPEITLHNGEVTKYDKNAVGYLDLGSGQVHMAIGGAHTDRSIIGTGAEELTHFSTLGFAKANPDGFNQYHEQINSFTPDQRYGFLKEFAKVTGYDKLNHGFDFDYYSGRGKPEEGHVYDALHNSYEFIGGLSRMYHEAILSGYKPKLSTLEQILPAPAYRLLKLAMMRTVGFFTGADEFGGILSPESRKRMESIFAHTRNDILKSEAFEYTAMKALDRVDMLGFSGFDKQLLTQQTVLDSSFGRRQRSGTKLDEIHQDTLNAIGAMKKDARQGVSPNSFEKDFLLPLQFSQVYQETRPLYDKLFGYMGNMKERIEDHFAMLGGYGQNGVSRSAGAKHATEILDFYHGNLDAVKRLGEAFEENQKRRDLAGFDNSKLLTPEELSSKFKMSKSEADYASKLLRLTDHVSKSTLEGIQERNKVLFAQDFYSRNPNLGIEGAIQAASTMLRPSSEMGILFYQKKQANYALSKLPEGSPERAKLQQLIKAYDTQLESYKLGIAQTMMKFGIDPKSAQVGADILHAKMSIMGYDAVQWTKLTEKQGYAPQTRNGKFIAIAVDPEGRKHTFDNDSQDRVAAKMSEWQKAGWDANQMSIFDKAAFEKKFAFSHVDDVMRLRDEQNAMLKGLIDGLQTKYVTDPSAVSALQELSAYYDIPDKDLSAIRAVKGDVYKMKRENVEGFNKGDYLANVLNYTKYRVAKTQRDIVKAQTALAMMDPFYVQNPEIAAKVKSHRDFVLGATSSDWSTFRNWLNVNYIGGSIKQLLNNSFQQMVNGTPQLVERLQVKHGAGAVPEAIKLQSKAVKMASEWALRGTTGDPILDHMMAVAKKEGKTTPAAIEAELPTSIEDYSVFSRMGKLIQEGGSGSLKLEQGKLAGYRTQAAALAILRKTAAVGEMVNRNVSVMTGLLAGRSIGIKDPKQLYEFATRYNEDVNFIGDKSNRPGWVSKHASTDSNVYGAFTTLMTLRSFQMNHIGQFYSLWKENKLGAWDYANNKRVNVEQSRQGFYTALAAVFAFGGASGVLLSQDLDEAMKSLHGKGWTDYIDDASRSVAKWTGLGEETGKSISEFLQRGPVFAATGVDTSSAGLGNIVNYSSNPTVSFADNVVNAAGVAPSYLKNTAAGITELINGNVEEAARKGSPTFIRQFIRLNDIATYGAPRNTLMQAKNITPLNWQQQLGAAAGFQTRPEIEFQGAESAKKLTDKQWQDYANSKAHHAAQILFKGGDEKTAKALAKAVLEKEKDRGEPNPEALVKNVTDELLRLKEAKLKPSSPANWKSYSQIDSSVTKPQGSAPYRSEVDSALAQFDVAQKLGLPEVAVAKVQALDGLHQKAFVDTLVRTNRMSPGEAKLLLRRLHGQRPQGSQGESSSE